MYTRPPSGLGMEQCMKRLPGPQLSDLDMAHLQGGSLGSPSARVALMLGTRPEGQGSWRDVVKALEEDDVALLRA